MDYQTTYQEVYAVIRDINGRIVGSGAAYNRDSVVTCAHVVNAALRLKADSSASQVGSKISVTFPLHPGLPDENRADMATVVQWFPISGQFNLKRDLAVLRLSDPVIIDMLSSSEQDMEFVGPLATGPQEFRMIYFDTNAVDNSSVEIFGKVGTYFPAEGKSVIFPDQHAMPFIQQGASGSPVFSSTHNGIIGLTQALKKLTLQGDSKTGFIIDSRQIAALIPDTLIRPKGFRYYGDEKARMQSDHQRKFGKNMCDRREMVQYAGEQIRNSASAASYVFLCTDCQRQEDSDDLLIRYKSEFIDPELHEELFLHVLRVPDISDLTLFKSIVIADFMESLEMVRPATKLTAEKTFSALVRQSAQVFEKPVICLIDCDIEKLRSMHMACFHWLRDEFFELKGVRKSKFHCHILFVGKYYQSKPVDKLNIIKDGFGTDKIVELTDVSLGDIHKWIDRFVAEHRKSKLRQQFRNNAYPMQEVFGLHDETNKDLLI